MEDMNTPRIVLFLWFIIMTVLPLSGQALKPYTKGLLSEKPIAELTPLMQKHLGEAGLKVVGSYQPAEDSDRMVLVVTSPGLLKAVQKTGGLTGLAATLRVAITTEKDGKQLVSYTTPAYWGNAYFRDDYPDVATVYSTLTDALEAAMKAEGSFIGTPFGAEDGLEVKKLRKYKYMFGMPKFDNAVKLQKFDSHNEAIAKIEANLTKGVKNLELVYAVELPQSKSKLYGLALGGENGEASFLPKIDIASPKHTAFLPYEILVVDNEVFMLHGRYRIALSFPDLTMGTFTKIMSTPGNIKSMMESATE